MRRAHRIEPVLHPEVDEAWFRNLTEARRAELHAAHQESADHDAAIVESLRRRLLGSCARHAALFGVIDALSPGASAGSALALAAAGACLGAGLDRLGAARLLSAALGMLAYLTLEIATRGGLSVLHFFWCVVLGAMAGLFALRREFGE